VLGSPAHLSVLRFLVVTTDYAAYQRWLLGAHPELADAQYEEQLRIRADTMFGLADFYSDALRELGHEAWDVVANSEPMQARWAREHGVRQPRWARRGGAWSLVRKGRTALGGRADDWLLAVLAAQIREYRPDVVLNQAMRGVSGRFLRTLGDDAGLLVGQAEPVELEAEDVGRYDGVVSSIQSKVDEYGRLGVPTCLLPHAFHPRALEAVDDGEIIPLSFVGSLSAAHVGRTRLLEAVATRFPELRLWSAGPPDSPLLRERYVGQAWGRDMYGVLARSRVTLNNHLDGLPFADNCRLFEATGVGSLLVTDWKPNLHELFEPGREVAAYRSVEECLALAGRYVADDVAWGTIARAGQDRTLREHTYRDRMERLLAFVGQLNHQ
jgi:spore maturation protein CgeB